MTDPKSLTTYTNDEVASILSRALDRQHDGRISHDELLETARDIGMTTLEVEASIQEEVRLRAEMLVREEQQQRAVRRFLFHLAVFVVLSAFFLVIDAKINGRIVYSWALLVWSAVVGMHAQRAFRKVAVPSDAGPAPSDAGAAPASERGAPESERDAGAPESGRAA